MPRGRGLEWLDKEGGERENECVSAWVYVSVSVLEQGKEALCVSVCLCVSVSVCQCVCVSVCVLVRVAIRRSKY